MMRWFSLCHLWLQCVHMNTGWQSLKLVTLLLCFPSFKCSYFFFKIAYSLNQRRLLRLCGEDFFLEFYGHRVASGGITNVLQSLRKIEHGLERAQASKHFTDHRITPV